MSASLSSSLRSWIVVGSLGACFFACGGEASDSEGGGSSGRGETGGSGNSTSGSGGRTGVYENGSFFGCTNPTDFIEGVDTGYRSCSEPLIWREEVLSCPNDLPQDNIVEFPQIVLDNAGGSPNETGYEIVADECSSNADCDEKSRCVARQVNAFGECIQPEDWPAQWARECIPGCTDDADCGDQQVCLCGPQIGQCMPISTVHGCASDADCDSGFHCLMNLYGAFGCQLPGDECQSAVDCSEPGEACGFDVNVDARVCQPFSEGC